MYDIYKVWTSEHSEHASLFSIRIRHEVGITAVNVINASIESYSAWTRYIISVNVSKMTKKHFFSVLYISHFPVDVRCDVRQHSCRHLSQLDYDPDVSNDF
jgi:hypothetical protein